MTCYHPIRAWKDLNYINPDTGKNGIVFSLPDGYSNKYYEPLELPCGRCIGCRLRRSRDWSVRCMAEAKLHKQTCFITLTYNNANLPDNGTLVKKDVQDFLKRLRKNLGVKVRYYMCGEYGTLNSRPHYHICLFGYDFPDKTLYKVNNGYPLYNSKILDTLWQHKGWAVIGSLTYESAAYVARYILKKVLGQGSAFYDLLGIIPEYTCMSRRPGIAADYFDKYQADIFAHDYKMLFKNSLVRPPRYFDKMFDVYYPESYNMYKRYMRAKALENPLYSADFKRLETCKFASIKRLIRPYEKGDV